MRKAEDQRNLVEIAKELPEEAKNTRTNGAGVTKRALQRKRRPKRQQKRSLPRLY